MNTLAWNCQGAGAYLTKQHLRELHRRFFPRFLFLSETKNNFSFLQDFQVEFGYDKLFTVEPEGLSGGLALFYMDSPAIKILFSSNRMIDIETYVEGHKVYMTFVYGDPVVKCREQVWERLTRFGLNRNGAWLMIGDFNEIIGNHEKRGGRSRSDASFLPFKTMLTNCGMIDFPYKGNFLSWAGRRQSGRVRCRLDRAVGNEEWHHLFSHTNVEYMKLWGSDHRPILARIFSKEVKKKRSFKFDKRWLGKDGLKETIQEEWGSTVIRENRDLHTKISSCRKAISTWRKNNPSNSAKQIDEIKKQLEDAQNDDSISAEEELELKWKLCSAYREEELFWKQKSRTNWLREGDRNTKFFHATTKQRRARNRITRLKDTNGAWIESEEGLERIASQYFQSLFTKTNTNNDFDESLRNVSAKVSNEMNTRLTRAPTSSEIKEATFSINPEKAPGPDGLTSLFYQKFWYVIGTDIIKTVKDFFETGVFDPRLNQTNICLIPKNERPQEMAEFRPISLCNVCYKIISKILSKRLKTFLPSLISETQSAFVARRLITDNILIAQEMFHALRTNPSCKSKFVAIKTDMSKAYDRVEWSFLEALMRKLGFSEKWIGWIMWCISSVSYQVLLNGEARGAISPSRGIRQGDPLSPFLFIICTEALIAQIRGAEAEGKLTGIKIARSSPPISHLLFADDSLFFCKADVLQCAELMNIINTYGVASGQQLNRSKSSIFFGSKVETSLKRQIKETLGISKEGGMGTYLGLPESICGSKKKVFSFVQERLHRRVNSWSSKLLSKGGKEVVIKSVAQAIPTFVMSCYKLPKEILSKLRSAIANFWWSTKSENRGMHWIAWDKICVPLDKGGLGFRDMENFNTALLAKQLWRLLIYPESLLARVLKGRYYRFSNPLEVKDSNSPSFGWRSIISSKGLLKAGLRRTIGSGYETRVWSDPWIPSTPARPAKSATPYRNPDLFVNHLINYNTKNWNLERIEQTIDAADVPLILAMKPCARYKQDGYSWCYTKSGHYSVRSGYLLAMELKDLMATQRVLEPSITPLKKEIWKLKSTRKLKHFLWQSVSGCVATADNLVDRHCGTDRSCSRCGAEIENINHILFECPPSVQTWAMSNIPSPPGKFPSMSLYSNFDFLLWRAKKEGTPAEHLKPFPWICWFLWKARNEKAFSGNDTSPQDVLNMAYNEAKSWEVANIMTETIDEESITEAEVEQVSFNPHTMVCQVDASWHSDDIFSGYGFVMIQENNIKKSGLTGRHKTLSPLYAECEALLWAMRMAIQEGITYLAMESDCSQLVKMIKDDDIWPAFSSEIEEFFLLRQNFIEFSISFIPRALNSRADSLAKEARARQSLFDHVFPVASNELALQANLIEPL